MNHKRYLKGAFRRHNNPRTTTGPYQLAHNHYGSYEYKPNLHRNAPPPLYPAASWHGRHVRTWRGGAGQAPSAHEACDHLLAQSPGSVKLLVPAPSSGLEGPTNQTVSMACLWGMQYFSCYVIYHVHGGVRPQSEAALYGA